MSENNLNKHPVSVWISLAMIGAIVTGSFFSSRSMDEMLPVMQIAIPILGAYAGVRQAVSSAFKK